MSEMTLETVGGRHVLRMRRRLAHRPERVWRAITDPSQIKHWFPAEVQLEVAVGAPVRFSFGGEGTVTAAEPWRLFEFTWGGTILRWELAPDGDDGCVLDFIHTFDDLPGAASFAAGWDACLTGLEALLDGRPAPEGGRMVREHEALVHRFDLDLGRVESTSDGWLVRFERQLTAPAAQAWEAAEPAGFAPFDDAVAGARKPPQVAEFDTADGHIRWELTDGTGHGARLIVTHTGRDGDPRATHDRWRDHIESYASHLAGLEG